MLDLFSLLCFELNLKNSLLWLALVWFGWQIGLYMFQPPYNQSTGRVKISVNKGECESHRRSLANNSGEGGKILQYLSSFAKE